MTVLLAVFAFAASCLGAYLLSERAASLGLMDRPGERSLHERPTPRGGGLATLAALALTWPVALWEGGGPGGLLWLVAGGSVVAAVSLLDDLRSLSAPTRLLAQFLGAVLLLVGGGFAPRSLELPSVAAVDLGVPGVVIGLVFVVWMMNLYNFMDGMDGFAAGMGAVGFGALAVLGWMAGGRVFAALALLIGASSLGFLCVNFPPARIFLGDVGSVTMGYFAAAFALWGARDGIVPLWATLLVFSPFIVDATVTLCARLLRGERVWEAHRSHYYQRLVRLGWGHRRTVLAEYMLMLATALSAVLLVRVSSTGLRWSGLVAWAGIYLAIGRSVALLEVRARRRPQ